MKRKLYHPLWVHLPAVGMIIWVIVEWIRCLPLPAVAPIHFGFGGRPDGWGSPTAVMALLAGLFVFMLGIGVLVDEVWARSEKAVRFNWMTWFDDTYIAWMGMLALGFLNTTKSDSQILILDYKLAAGVSVACAVVSLLLESKRKFVPKPERNEAETAFETPTKLVARIKSGSDWTYWESQNPWWVSLLAIGVPIFVLGEAAVAYAATHSLLQAAGVAIVGILCIGLYGGFRIMVTRETITVRLGIFGIRLMRLPLTEIGSVETHEFFPLKDFGGYGIRFNRHMKGYFLRGNVGVLITDIRGKKTLIGSDNPERLVAVIKAAKEL